MNKNILIIDDNPINCMTYINPLKEKYDVTVVKSLEDAVRKAQMYFYNIIVIDIMMPTRGLKNKDDLKTGLYLYQEKLKVLESKNKIKFLFWSNLTQETYNEFFGEKKPTNVDFLHKALKNVSHLYEKVNLLMNE